jgi:hypothetical protein
VTKDTPPFCPPSVELELLDCGLWLVFRAGSLKKRIEKDLGLGWNVSATVRHHLIRPGGGGPWYADE